ncbi:MAG: glycosyltransferase, partial [Pseudomonadota bacterium]
MTHHITHIVHRFDTGGLENGIVNLINWLPGDYRHSILCLTDYSQEFAKRLKKPVEIRSLHKQEGKDLKIYLRLYKALRELRPDILHSRNLSTLEAQVVAFFAGVSGRVHGEHGWDMYDLGGTNKKYQLLRRLVKPFVHHFIALSPESQTYLLEKIRVPKRKVSQIFNGVDSTRFAASSTAPTNLDASSGLLDSGNFCFVNVGRMARVKNP